VVHWFYCLPTGYLCNLGYESHFHSTRYAFPMERQREGPFVSVLTNSGCGVLSWGNFHSRVVVTEGTNSGKFPQFKRLIYCGN